MHLEIHCEGETERIFKHILHPFWSKRFSSADVITYDGAPDLKKRLGLDAGKILADQDT